MITFLDPTFPARLPGKNEVLDFIVSTGAVGFTASLRYPNGQMETIYQDGLIGAQYNVLIDGTTFHVTRKGGWPNGRFSLPMTEAAAAITPAWTPLTDQLARYKLLGGSMGNDDSGNDRDLVAENEQYNGPDLLRNITTLHRGRVRAAIPALAVIGDLTISMRVWQRWANEDPQCLLECRAAAAGSATNCAYRLYSTFPGTVLLNFYSESGSNSGSTTATGIVLSPPLRANPWVWVTLRRTGNTIRAGRDKTFSNFTHTAATGGASGSLSIGKTIGDSQVWQGGIADVSIYNRYLSDDELNANYDTVFPVGLQ